MQRLITGSVLAAVAAIAVAAGFLLLPNDGRVTGGGRTAEAGIVPVLSASCYPRAQFMMVDDWDGHAPFGLPIAVSGSGTARFYESELESNFNDGDFSGGLVTWSFKGDVQGTTVRGEGIPYFGRFGGSLNFSIKWDNGGMTTFNSRCLTELASKNGCDSFPCSQQIELYAEGTVFNFPYESAIQPAVAKIELKRVNGTSPLQLRIAVRLGTTCTEVQWDEGHVELGLGAGIQANEEISTGGETLLEEYGVVSGMFKSVAASSGAFADPSCSNPELAPAKEPAYGDGTKD